MEDLKNIKFDFEFYDLKINSFYNTFHEIVSNKMKLDIQLCIAVKEFKDLFNDIQKYKAGSAVGQISFYNLMFVHYGLSKTTVFNMVSLVNRFVYYNRSVDGTINVDNFYFIHSVMEKINISKLFELFPLKNEKIIELLDTGVITPNTTQKQIREIVKSYTGEKTAKVLDTETKAEEVKKGLNALLDKEEPKKKSDFKPTDKYIDGLLDFYKGYKTEDKQLLKLIIINLQNIKNHYLKEIENSGN